MPGDGFFALASKLGWQVESKRQFFKSELKRVIDYWKEHA